VKDDKAGDESYLSPTPLVTPVGTALSNPENADALADSLQFQFQPVKHTSDPAIIDKVEDALHVYSYTPASEPKITSPMEVKDAIRGLKVGKAPGSKVYGTGL
jgi:hypothetical protein